MAKYDIEKFRKKLVKELDAARYEHTMGVMYMSMALAMAHGLDLEQAQVAGLLHDCAKCIPNKNKLKICKDNRIPLTDFEKTHPYLIHAKLGAFIAETKYEVKDPEILRAITFHTTGRAAMGRLEEIVYIADYIEPLRYKAPNLAGIRQLAFKDLDLCMYVILKDTLSYLEKSPDEIDNTTREAFEYYEEIIDDRDDEIVKYWRKNNK